MRTVETSPLADKDLEDIVYYVSEYSLPSAEKTVKELVKKFNLLAQNPQMGVSRDNYILGMRTFPHKDYVIFYFPTENGIEIYRVIHGARNIDDLFEELIEGLKP